MRKFGFGDPGQPDEAMAMFGIKILSCEKPPAMFDNSALATNRKDRTLGEVPQNRLLRAETGDWPVSRA